MKLTERVQQAEREHRELYAELQEKPIDLDEFFSQTIGTIHYNYAGYPLKHHYFTPNEYRTYILTRQRYKTLTVQALVRCMHQFAADMHDRHLRFTCTDWVDYKNTDPRFRVRACKDGLYVTRAEEGSSLVPGDFILELQQMSPERIRHYMRYNSFYSREPERELWGGYLSMVRDVKVRHADGREEVVLLNQYPRREEEYPLEFRMLNDRTAYLQIERMDTEALEALVSSSREQIESSEKLILDLRRNIGGEDDAGWCLFPYLTDRSRTLESLLADEGCYVNFSKVNCELRYNMLSEYKSQVTDSEQLQILEDEIQLYVRNYNKGLVYQAPAPAEEITFEPAAKAPRQVIVLTDTFCENEGEQFAAMCSRCGSKVRVIGRPTMGTLDFFDNINLVLNEHMTLSYPIRMTKAAYEGRGIAEKGLPVSEYIPWTPDEIREDLILRRALENKPDRN